MGSWFAENAPDATAATAPATGSWFAQNAPPPPPPPPTLGQRAIDETLNLGRQIGSGLSGTSAATAKLVANTADILDSLAGHLSDRYGVEKGGLFSDISDWARHYQAVGEQEAAKQAGGRTDFPSQVVRGVTQGVAELPTYTVATLAAGPVLGVAGLGALSESDQGWTQAMKAAAEGAVMGKVLHILAPGSRPVRLTGGALTGFAAAKLKGADNATALSQATSLGLLSGMSPGGIPAREFVPGLDVAATAAEGAAKGAWRGGTEMAPLRKFGIPLTVPRPFVTAPIGAGAARMVGLPHELGTAVGFAYPFVEGAYRGAREALAERRNPPPPPPPPGPPPPPPELLEGLAQSQLGKSYARSTAEEQMAIRGLADRIQNPPAEPAPRPAAAAPVPIPVETGPGEVPAGQTPYLTVGQGALEYNAPGTAPEAPPAAPAPEMPAHLRTHEAQAAAQELEASMRAGGVETRVPATEEPAAPEPPQNPPGMRFMEPDEIARYEARKAAGEFTPELLTTFIQRNKIPTSMVAQFGPEEWRLVAERAGVPPPTIDHIATIRKNLGEYDQAGVIPPGETEAGFAAKKAVRNKRKAAAVETKPAAVEPVITLTKPDAQKAAEDLAAAMQESGTAAPPPAPEGAPAPTASQKRVEALAQHLAPSDISSQDLANMPSEPKSLALFQQLSETLGHRKPTAVELQQVVARVRELRGEAGPAGETPAPEDLGYNVPGRGMRSAEVAKARADKAAAAVNDLFAELHQKKYGGRSKWPRYPEGEEAPASPAGEEPPSRPPAGEMAPPSAQTTPEQLQADFERASAESQAIKNDPFLQRVARAGEEATQRLRDQGIIGGEKAPLGAFLDPNVIRDFSLSIAGDIARGALTFRQFTSRMVKQYGPEIKPFLPQIWHGAVDLETLMNKPVAVKPGPQGFPLTSDVGAALEAEVGRKQGKLGPAENITLRRTRAIEQAASDLRYFLTQENNGQDWYTAAVDRTEKILKREMPELHDPVKMGLFKYVLAVTSNSVNPQVNFGGAMKAWDLYMKTGKMHAYDPDTGVAMTYRAKSYKTAMDVFSRLIADKKEAGALEWLMTEHPVSELNAWAGKGKVPGAATDMKRGAYVLGPKVGPFGSNLNGIHTELTADKWWSRTWNRWMGTIMATDEHGLPVLDEKGQPAIQDTPRNEGERKLMREVASHVAGTMGLTVSELQAVLWYAEQSLYRAHGLDARSITYEDAARTYFDNRRTAVRSKGNAGNRGPAEAGRKVSNR